MKKTSIVVVVFATLAVPTLGLAAPEPTTVDATAGSACAALGTMSFADLPDAPTQVTAAKLVVPDGRVPAYCRVAGYVAPSVGFELRLPAVGWNGKFAHIGCGGFCGSIFAGACDSLLARGYACIATDMGHRSTALDGKWAYDNPQAKLDFAYRATHVATVAGKAITQAFFGKAASRSYFLGCSTGGRQGLVEAQRFPTDFDGIVSGAPVISELGDGMALLWNVRAALGPDGHPLLTPEDVRRVHAAAVARCDRDDGVADGLIGDPRACRFDPAELRCTAGKTGDCLSAAQVEAVRKIYAGPVNSRGQALYTGGALPGSELNWIGPYVPADAGGSIYAGFMSELFRYMAFIPDPGPSWKPADFDWDRDPPRLAMMESLYSGSNPDLRRFKAAGGKLIVYQGWADQSVLPLNIIDYYETAERTMGGRAPTQEFLRLFMIPGMNHCYGGEGAYTIDYLSGLEAWVERGEAPDALRSVHPKTESPLGVTWGAALPGAEDTLFSRPAYPYPLQPRYLGKGDPRDAESYLPQGPAIRAATATH
jgi:feruloyl esterase